MYLAGPTHWYEITSDWHYCGGSTQSPINIRTSVSTYREDLEEYPLQFENLCLRIPARIRNNGKIKKKYAYLRLMSHFSKIKKKLYRYFRMYNKCYIHVCKPILNFPVIFMERAE